MKKFRLTPAGIAVLISLVLFVISIAYATFQPKQVEYIYRQIFGEAKELEEIRPPKVNP